MTLRTLIIRPDEFNPALHRHPVAAVPIQKGHVLAMAVGEDTFTVERADASIGYFDGIALNDADVGQPVTLVVTFSTGDPDSARIMVAVEEFPKEMMDDGPSPDIVPELDNLTAQMMAEWRLHGHEDGFWETTPEIAGQMCRSMDAQHRYKGYPVYGGPAIPEATCYLRSTDDEPYPGSVRYPIAED